MGMQQRTSKGIRRDLQDRDDHRDLSYTGPPHLSDSTASGIGTFEQHLAALFRFDSDLSDGSMHRSKEREIC